jgi:hypothetical protein
VPLSIRGASAGLGVVGPPSIRGSSAGLVLLLALFLASCGGERAEDRVEGGSTTGPLGAHRADELVRAAEDIVAFLRGETGSDRLALADTVGLYLPREGGGTLNELAREQLGTPSGWMIRSPGGESTYRLAPPAGRLELTARAGRHFRCFEYPLPAEFEELARLPHVGTKLEPPGGGSCLQSWNLTMVFDPVRRPPTLVAVIYDQWEW